MNEGELEVSVARELSEGYVKKINNTSYCFPLSFTPVRREHETASLSTPIKTQFCHSPSHSQTLPDLINVIIIFLITSSNNLLL